MAPDRGPAERRYAVPGWVVAGSLVLCVLGLGISGYLTYEHFTASTSLVCSDKGAVNCLKVTTSPWSRVFGFPVSVLGLLYWAGMTVLCLPQAWRVKPLAYLRGLAAVAGVGMVFYLVWAEAFRIHAICLWCTGVHAVTLLMFLLVLVALALGGPPLPALDDYGTDEDDDYEDDEDDSESDPLDVDDSDQRA